MLDSYLDVYHMNENGSRFKLKYRKKEIAGNMIYIEFDISESTRGTFYLHLYNPVGSMVALAADLLNGGYRLVNLNQYQVDMVSNDDTRLYEAHGITGKYLFVDIKMCIGDVNVGFFQEDYELGSKQNSTDYKTIKDSNSFVHYQKLNKTRVFVRVKNEKAARSIYLVNLFNERDLDNNPYTEVSQGAGGKVDIETDTNSLRFAPLKMKSNYKGNFVHRLTYTAYLSDAFKVMRFAKNCGRFMLNQAFEDKEPHLLSFAKVVTLATKADILAAKQKLDMKMAGLRGNTKYYGIVVA